VQDSTGWPPPQGQPLWGLECRSTWVRRYAEAALNVFRMKLLGATVTEVSVGLKTLKDAINEALRD